MQKSRHLQISFLLFTIIFEAINPSIDALGAVTPPVTKCNIRVDNPHISKYILRTRGILAVKVNARSKCDKFMRDLKFIVEIYKDGFFWDKKVGGGLTVVNGLIYPNRIIRNEKAYSECSSQLPTKYYGVAYASAIIDGESKQTLKVTSAETITLNCGH
jgi:hypothetical protein